MARDGAPSKFEGMARATLARRTAYAARETKRNDRAHTHVYTYNRPIRGRWILAARREGIAAAPQHRSLYKRRTTRRSTSVNNERQYFTGATSASTSTVEIHDERITARDTDRRAEKRAAAEEGGDGKKGREPREFERVAAREKKPPQILIELDRINRFASGTFRLPAPDFCLVSSARFGSR